MSRRNWLSMAALCAALLSPGSGAQAQSLPGAAIGGAAGVAAGGYVTLAITVLGARRGEYIYNMEEFLGWRSAPVIAGAAAGAVYGYFESDRLLATALFAVGGTGLGVGAGLLLGPVFDHSPEARWAGAAVGAGAGMVLGTLLGVLATESGDERDRPQAVSVPLVSIRF